MSDRNRAVKIWSPALLSGLLLGISHGSHSKQTVIDYNGYKIEVLLIRTWLTSCDFIDHRGKINGNNDLLQG